MRPRRIPIAAFALLVALALVVAGCGGGGDDTTAPAETTAKEAAPELTKADLIARGDGICGEVNAAIGAIGSSEEGEVAEQTTEVAKLYVGMIESLQALGRPAETDGYGEFWAAAEELAKVEGEIKLAAERADTAALGEAATEAAPVLEEFQAQAAIYGFEECSQGPSAPPTPATGGGAGGGEVEEGGVEVAPELEAEATPEEVAPEEVAPETGGGVGGEEPAPEGGGEEGSSGGGIGPG